LFNCKSVVKSKTFEVFGNKVLGRMTVPQRLIAWPHNCGNSQ